MRKYFSFNKNYWISQLLILTFGFICHEIIEANRLSLTYSDFKDSLPKLILYAFIFELIVNLFSKKLSALPSLIVKIFNDENKTLGNILLLCLSLTLGYSMLFEKWTSAMPGQYSIYNGYFTQGGYLPHSDALGYLWGVQTFIHYGEIVSTAIYRPLGTLFYAVLFKLCGHNFTTLIMLITGLVSISIYCVARVIFRHLGLTAGVLMTVLLSQYSFSFTANFMTENPGLIFGNIGIALLFHGLFSKQKISFYLGISMITIALNIRTGAMFILPLLLLLPGFLFKGDKKLFNIKQTVIAIGVYILSSYSTEITMKLFETKQKAISNIGYVLYQLHVGAPSWTQINQDHPEFLDQKYSFEERTQLVNEFAIKTVKENPTPIIKNIFQLHKRVLSEPIDFLYHFNYLLDKKRITLLFICSFLIFLLAKAPSEKWFFAALLVAMIGTFASAPFLEETRPRVYAATVAINCAFVCVGMSMIIRGVTVFSQKLMGSKNSTVKATVKKNNKNTKIPIPNKKIQWRNLFKLNQTALAVSNDVRTYSVKDILLYSLSILLLSLALIGPIIIDKTRVKPRDLSGEVITCDKAKFIFDIKSSPWMKIISDNNQNTIPHYKTMRTFQNNSPRGIMPLENFYLVNTINLLNKKDAAIIYFKSDEFEKYKSGYAVMCLDTVKGEGNPLYAGELLKVIEN